jgi:hypothetical protein
LAPDLSMPSASSPEPEALPRGAIASLALTVFEGGMSLRVNDALLPQLAQEFGVSLGSASHRTRCPAQRTLNFSVAPRASLLLAVWCE